MLESTLTPSSSALDPDGLAAGLRPPIRDAVEDAERGRDSFSRGPEVRRVH
jgi:hypothetical protein